MFPALKKVQSKFPLNFNGWIKNGDSNHNPEEEEKHMNGFEEEREDKEEPLQVLIRKNDLNLHRYDTRNKNLIRHIEQSDDFIDDLDLQMIKLKQRLEQTNYKAPMPKWLNAAWDAYRLVENHSRAMIFQFPEPGQPEYDKYIEVVQEPMDLDVMKVRSLV